MSPILHGVVSHTVGRGMRRCGRSGPAQIGRADLARESVRCDVCKTPMLPLPARR